MGKHARPPVQRGKQKGGRRRALRQPSTWRELPLLAALALIVALLVKTFVVQAFFIPSGSMETTLHGCTGCQGDRVLVNKLSYRVGSPQRGQIVVFRGTSLWPNETSVPTPHNALVSALITLSGDVGLGPSNETDFIKRLIGLPGDTVMCCDPKGRIEVNGHPVDEPYLYQDNRRAFGPKVVPAGNLWVMGDHRSDSSDARDNGPIPVANVVGRAFVLVYPVKRFRLLRGADDFVKAHVGG